MMQWIWQLPDWPRFTWNQQDVAGSLSETVRLQGQLNGKAEAAGDEFTHQSALDTLLHNILASSAIEEEKLDVGSVRSSLAHRLGLASGRHDRATAKSEGVAELILDATSNTGTPLVMDRLFQWHRLLFPPGFRPSPDRLRVGELRGDYTMQVVSGRLDEPTIHFEAPPAARVEAEMMAFLAWFNQSRTDPAVDPLVRAGVAHLWVVTIHPFEDGNGRLARAIADLALAQADPATVRLYTLSGAILKRRRDYYRILEASQRGPMNVTPWLCWFLETLKIALLDALGQVDRVLDKARFWRLHSGLSLLPAQIKVLNRLLEGASGDFEHGINATRYQHMAHVSKATATRHLADLVAMGCLERQAGGGRSTRYQIRFPRSRGSG